MQTGSGSAGFHAIWGFVMCSGCAVIPALLVSGPARWSAITLGHGTVTEHNSNQQRYCYRLKQRKTTSLLICWGHVMDFKKLQLEMKRITASLTATLVAGWALCSPCNISGLKCQADVSTWQLKFSKGHCRACKTHKHTHIATATESVYVRANTVTSLHKDAYKLKCSHKRTRTHLTQ